MQGAHSKIEIYIEHLNAQAEYVEKLPSGFHSTKGVGKTEPDPATFEELDGAKVIYFSLFLCHFVYASFYLSLLLCLFICLFLYVSFSLSLAIYFFFFSYSFSMVSFAFLKTKVVGKTDLDSATLSV